MVRVPPHDRLGDDAIRFAGELDRLVQELWTWSPSRLAAPVRRQALQTLGEAWVGVSRDHGGDAPGEARLPVLEPHGLPDLLAVLGREVLRTPDAERAATQALVHLAAARAAVLPAARA